MNQSNEIDMLKTSLVLILFSLLISATAQVNPVTSYNNRIETPQKSTSSNISRRIELSPFVGYQMNGKINFVEGDFKMDNAMSYGGMLSVEVAPQIWGEFTYSRTDTKANFRRFLGVETYHYDMAINYFQLGGVKELGDNRVVPFGTFSGGVAWFQMKDNGVSGEVVFSVGLGGGLKVKLSDRVALRLQGRLLLPMYIYGGGFFVGIGTGGPSSGISINSNLLTAQGDFTGGLIFRLGN